MAALAFAAVAALAPIQTAQAQQTLSLAGTFPRAALGQPYHQSAIASGGSQPYIFAEQGTLPAGMAWSGDSTSVTLTGTPAASGNFNLSIQVTDASGATASDVFTLTVGWHAHDVVPIILNESITTTDSPMLRDAVLLQVAESITTTDTPLLQDAVLIRITEGITVTDSPATSTTALSITPASISPGLVGSTFGPVTITIAGGAGAPFMLGESGSLPPGLGLSGSGSSLTLSGSPTVAGSYPVTFSGMDSAGAMASQSYTLVIGTNRNGGALAINPATLFPPYLGSSYGPFSITATGGSGSGYSLSYTGTLPPGLTMSAPGSSLTISGTPTSGGTYTFTVSATDSSANTASQMYSLSVGSGGGGGCPPSCGGGGGGQYQSINSGLIPYGHYGDASFTMSATASSGLPVSYSVISGPASGTNPFTISGAGTVYIVISQSGGTNNGVTYAAASSVNVPVLILKAPIYVSPMPQTRIFDAPNADPYSYTIATAGWKFSESYASVCAAATPTVLTSNCGTMYAMTSAIGVSPPGTYDVTMNTANLSAANYSFFPCEAQSMPCGGQLTISGTAPQIINFTAVPSFFIENVQMVHLLAAASSGLPVTFTVQSGPATVSGDYLTVTGAGMVTLVASQAGNADYTAAPNVTQTFTVSQ